MALASSSCRLNLQHHLAFFAMLFLAGQETRFAVLGHDKEFANRPGNIARVTSWLKSCQPFEVEAWQRERITRCKAAAEIKAGTRKVQAKKNKAGKAAEIRKAARRATLTRSKGVTIMARKSKDKGGEKTKPPKKLSKKSG
ncbi:MAG: hypothetical protein ACJ74Z_06140 [Bryobacteraceae bacterium]